MNFRNANEQHVQAQKFYLFRAAQGKGLVPAQHNNLPTMLQIWASLPDTWQNCMCSSVRRARAPSQRALWPWDALQSKSKNLNKLSLFARKSEVSFTNTKKCFCLLFLTPWLLSLGVAIYSFSTISQQSTHFTWQVEHHKMSVTKPAR